MCGSDIDERRLNSPSGHRSESRASQRSWPKRPVIFSVGLPSFPSEGLIRLRNITGFVAREGRPVSFPVVGWSRRLRRFPRSVFLWQTYRTGSITGGDCRGFVPKEHAVLHVAAARDGLQRRRTAEEAVQLPGSVSAQAARPFALIRFAVRSDQRPGSSFGHAVNFAWRRGT